MEVDIEQRFRLLWEATGLTMDDFATELGEKSQRVKDVLRGKTKLPAEILLTVQHRMPVNMEWFFGDDEQPIFLKEPHFLAYRSARRQSIKAEEPESPLAAIRDVLASRNIDANSFVFIRHYDVKASAGLGHDNADASEEIKQYNAFRRTFWQREMGLSPDECFSMDVTGTSMYPFLTERHVPIFHEEQSVSTESVYAFRYQKELFVKRLDRVPGEGLVVRSEDPKVKTWTISDHGGDQDFKVIGRLVFKQLGEKV